MVVSELTIIHTDHPVGGGTHVYILVYTFHLRVFTSVYILVCHLRVLTFHSVQVH